MDYLNFNKNQALKVLIDNYEYKPYPYKHYESVFTRFYQGYILPNKFGVDKRKLHLSVLIASEQMTKVEALDIMKESAYPSTSELSEDIDYFLKKMDWTSEQLNSYMKEKNNCHSDYKSEKILWDKLKRIYLKFK